VVAVASAAVATDSGGGDAVMVVPFPLLHSIVGGFVRELPLARSQSRDADPVFVEMSRWEALLAFPFVGVIDGDVACW
jgi:hypothetical protein